MTAQAPHPGPLLQVSAFIQAVPALAYLLTRHRTRPGALVAFGGLWTVLATVIGAEMGRIYGNNYIVGYVSIPVTAGAYLLALAEWQVTYLERLTIRIALALFVTIYLVLVAYFENTTHLGQFSHTLYSLVLLSAALWTLGRLSLSQEESLAIDTDWFWVAFGIAIYGAATAATAAIGNILMARDRVDLFVKAWNVRGALVILAFLAVSWGVFRGPPRSATVDLKR